MGSLTEVPWSVIRPSVRSPERFTPFGVSSAKYAEDSSPEPTVYCGPFA